MTMPTSAGQGRRRGRPATRLLGLPVDAITAARLYALCIDAMSARRPLLIGHHNLHGLHLACQDRELAAFYRHADRCYADGMPVVWLSRLRGIRLERRHRLTSIDFLPGLLRLCAARRFPVFMLGGTPETTATAAPRYRAMIPGLDLAVHHGYFDRTPGGTANRAVLDAIASHRTALLLVGMGMPIQERWLLANRHLLPPCTAISLGAFMDYVAGTQVAPPRWAGRMGLEWLFRLAGQPRRLGRRYLVEPLLLAPHLLADAWRRHPPCRGG